MSNTVDISLILACYNEGSSLESSLETIVEVLNATRYSWEIVCIDDCSNDSTRSILEHYAKAKNNVRVYSHTLNVGRGGTVVEGFSYAHGRVVGFIDVDLEVSAIYIPEFVGQVDRGADVVLATRIYKESLSSIIRFLASKLYLLLVKLVFGVKFQDTEAGYKFFNREKLLLLLPKVKDTKWFFDTEIVLRAAQAGFKIIEVPVLFLRRGDKKSTVRLVHDSIEYLRALWRFKNAG